MHQVGAAAGDDEQGEQAEDPGIGQVSPPQDEHHQDDGNGKIRETGRDIRDQVQPYEVGFGQRAYPADGAWSPSRGRR
jgi:hypothetical protein